MRGDGNGRQWMALGRVYRNVSICIVSPVEPMKGPMYQVYRFNHRVNDLPSVSNVSNISNVLVVSTVPMISTIVPIMTRAR